MNIREIELKREYRSLIDEIARDFYIPLLSHAISYDRAVGYFSSSILAQISAGISKLKLNGGKIRIVSSPHLSEDDVNAIRVGYKKREEIIRSAIMRELKTPKNEFEKKYLNILANLIADNILDIKIAFTEKSGRMGMYHEKMGIISDFDGNEVAFSGSMNETSSGLSANYEAIDVFCSWKDEETDRVLDKRRAFEAIWSNNEPEVKTIEFPELKDELIKQYKTSIPNWEKIDDTIFEIQTEEENFKANYSYPTIPNWLVRAGGFRDYQVKAIQKWKDADYQGIFDMATGTGKTLTGLGALLELAKDKNNNFAAIVVVPYQHLVEQWVEDIEEFNIKPIIGYSASKQRNWFKNLENSIRDQKIGAKGKNFFLFICTNATFSTERVQTLIQKIKKDILLIVDEAHNFGAPRLRKTLTNAYKYKLALSATVDRHNDEEGTQALYDYFGEKCIEYSLEEAIGVTLTKYYYYPIICHLNMIELDAYTELTREIRKCLTTGRNGKLTLSEKGKMLALKRARVISGAVDKLSKLKEIIQGFKNDQHMLIYCGATNLLQPQDDSSKIEDNDIRQIEAVSSLLGNELGIKSARFTSQEDMPTRKKLKEQFTAGDLQVLVAIKCLDEGVNIPAIKKAFILASTTNPKEYIQRRGRVLRKYKGKEYAEIYDFLTLPRTMSSVTSLTEQQRKDELTLIKNEIKRAEEFARSAINMQKAQKERDNIKASYFINEHLIITEEEF